MSLLSIDPGTTRSGFVILDDDNHIEDHGIITNEGLRDLVKAYAMVGNDLAIEMIASYGMPVGREIFQTCVWIGRFIEAHIAAPTRDRTPPGPVVLVTRNEVKNHLCGSSKAKDPNVMQALLDLFGPKGKKANPGPTFGMAGDMWAALGVAATVRKLEAP